MDARQAKDFLVEQAARQAAIEGIPLSSIEKRMMYFTEGPDAVEDPVQLNEEFEAQYDMDEYESKLSQLLKHARARLTSEDPAQLETWNQAVTTLRKGDHYLLILLGGLARWMPSAPSLPGSAMAKLSIRILVPIAAVVGIVLLVKKFGHSPRVSAYVYFGLFVASYLAALWLSRESAGEPLRRAGKAITRYLFGDR